MVGMPLLNLGYALGGLTGGYNQAQSQAMQRAVQQLAYQQALNQQQARAALGNALSQGLLKQQIPGFGGGIRPIAQPPMPGQPSVPAAPYQPQQPPPTQPPPPSQQQPPPAPTQSLPDPEIAYMQPQAGPPAVDPTDAWVQKTRRWDWQNYRQPSTADSSSDDSEGLTGGGDIPDDGGTAGPAGGEQTPVSFATPQERRAWYHSEAARQGVSPSLIDRVVGSEGGWSSYDTRQDRGTSFGPFAMHVGGPAMPVKGLGDEFRAKTGLDPSDPRNEKAVAQFAIAHIAQYGASPDTWHGLRGGASTGTGRKLSAPDQPDQPAVADLAPPRLAPPPQGYDLNDLARQLKQANPDLNPEALFDAIEMYSGVLDKTSSRAWDQFKFEVEEQDKALDRQLRGREFDVEQARLKAADFRSDRSFGFEQQKFEYEKKRDEARDAEKGWDIYYDPTNNYQPYRLNKNTGEAVDFQGKPYKPGGVQKVGTQPVISPQTQSDLVDLIGTYRAPPPSISGWSGPRAQQIMTEVAKKYPNYDATQYAGKAAGARSVGTRSAQLEMNTRVAEEEIPLALQTSQRIDRTQYPTINSMILAVEKGTGSEDVVRFLDQINALKYTYGAALSRTGMQTVDAMRRFDQILDPAWSQGQIAAALDQIKQTLAAERRGIEKSRGGPGDTGTGQKSSAGSSDAMPLPPEFSADPDGQGYEKDGAVWVKRGNQLIRTPGATAQ